MVFKTSHVLNNQMIFIYTSISKKMVFFLENFKLSATIVGARQIASFVVKVQG